MVRPKWGYSCVPGFVFDMTFLIVFVLGTDAYLHLSRLGDSQEPLP